MNCDHREWLEADGLGGFSSGTVSGERTRRYQVHLKALRQKKPMFKETNAYGNDESFVSEASAALMLTTRSIGQLLGQYLQEEQGDSVRSPRRLQFWVIRNALRHFGELKYDYMAFDPRDFGD